MQNDGFGTQIFKKKPKIVLKPKYWNIEILRRKSLALKYYQEERWRDFSFQIEVF